MSAAREATPPPVPGYELLEPLGSGGMGEVFRARQESLGREVAVKILRTDLPATGWLPERFEQEACTMGALRHPNVVTVHDCVRLDDGRVAIVMEFVSGGSLREKLNDAPDGLPLEQALKWAREIAEGLRAAHAAGLVHRDVKPDNVLIDEAGTARVSDFGLAFSDDVKQPRYTQTGAAAGTPGYMPPELWRGEAAAVRSDVFSYGAMLYEILTGRLPQGSFPPPRALRPDISPALNDAIVAALRPDPAQRPTDMAAMLHALAARAVLFTRRRAVVAAAIATGGTCWWMVRRSGTPGLSTSTETPGPILPSDYGPWLRLPWPQDPGAAAIRGDWRMENGMLLSDESIALLPVTAVLPESWRLRLVFTRLTGTYSIAVLFSNRNGTASATLAGRGRNVGGLQTVGGLTLDESGGFEFNLENGRRYEWIIELRAGRFRMWVDGEMKYERLISGMLLTVPVTWNWKPPDPPPDLVLGSWNSSTRFESLEWQPLK